MPIPLSYPVTLRLVRLPIRCSLTAFDRKHMTELPSNIHHTYSMHHSYPSPDLFWPPPLHAVKTDLHTIPLHEYVRIGDESGLNESALKRVYLRWAALPPLSSGTQEVRRMEGKSSAKTQRTHSGKWGQWVWGLSCTNTDWMQYLLLVFSHIVMLSHSALSFRLNNTFYLS